MLNYPLIISGKAISKFAKVLNLGNGSTWPGHIALNLNKKFIKQFLKKSKTKIVIIAGTNGKTTTASLITNALRHNNGKVIQNESGANLLNGIASTLIMHSSATGGLDADYAIFEIDENNLPLVLKEVTPDALLLLNLFRDQLDRYGEINTIGEKWKKSISFLSKKTTLILNSDDPLIAYMGKDTKNKKLYFGLHDSNHKNNHPQDDATDSSYCPNCNGKLIYKNKIFSHLGDWKCRKCKFKRPNPDVDFFENYPLPGTYNKYNTHAAIALLKHLKMKTAIIKQSIKDFKPAFGRQENIKYKNKNIQIYLSKNPTSFNQSLNTILDLDAKNLLIILNDRIPDGRDISWIWDTEMNRISKFKNIFVAGDRAYDMALRLKYEMGITDYQTRVKVIDNLKNGIEKAISYLEDDQILFMLPTYSGMLDARKILTGRRIL